jgi:phosphoribosylformimino-5-aminoimidazole carboxamide ribotide isomerase
MQTLDAYFNIGISRAILGTAAVSDESFLRDAILKYGDKIAVGADVKDGYIAIKGWVEKSEYTLDAFFSKMQSLGVKTVICTDISKDGAMRGTNLEMYKLLSNKYSVDIIASGGVSSIDDVRELRSMNLYGAIIGKAYYVGAIKLDEAIEVAR